MRENFLIQTELETRRLRLTKFVESDITLRYVSWLNDPEVVRFSENRHSVHTEESCREYFLSFENSDNMLWTIRRREAGDEHIGNVAAYVDMPNRVADVSILLGEKSVWGMGFGREAFACVCIYLFNSCNVRKVTAGTMSENTAMLAIMRGIGMTEEGRRARQFLLDGREVDMVYGSLFEWNSTITE